MNGNLIINNDNIRQFKKIKLILENLEYFEIDVDYILDINLVCSKKGVSKKEYWSNKGYIKFHKDVKYMLSDYGKSCMVEYDEENDINDSRFMNRIPKYYDIVGFSLFVNDKKNVDIYIPYGVVESLFGEIIEFSDCHSYELDEDKNILINYGELSTMPKKQNIYFENVIDNWKDILPRSFTQFANFIDKKYYYKDKEGRVTVTVIGTIKDIKNNDYDVRLIFYGVRDYEEDDTEYISFIEVYKLASGDYFVQLGYAAEFKFDGCYIERECVEE